MESLNSPTLLGLHGSSAKKAVARHCPVRLHHRSVEAGNAQREGLPKAEEAVRCQHDRHTHVCPASGRQRRRPCGHCRHREWRSGRGRHHPARRQQGGARGPQAPQHRQGLVPVRRRPPLEVALLEDLQHQLRQDGMTPRAPDTVHKEPAELGQPPAVVLQRLGGHRVCLEECQVRLRRPRRPAQAVSPRLRSRLRRRAGDGQAEGRHRNRARVATVAAERAARRAPSNKAAAEATPVAALARLRTRGRSLLPRVHDAERSEAEPAEVRAKGPSVTASAISAAPPGDPAGALTHRRRG